MDLVADIKARLNIEDLVSGYVQLKNVGRNFKGLCPFHQEKTPSFHVSVEKQLAYCFGCHRGGDMFQFIQEVENVDFSESLKILSERAGLDFNEYRQTGKKVPSKSEKEPFFEAHVKATDFFSAQLWNTPEGSKVQEYLTHRGMKEKTIRDFRLGFAPDEFDALSKTLLNYKIPKTALIQSGLIIAKDVSGEQVYDRFRGRLMFPITNLSGQIVAFGGRALKKGMEPKYLNSPETLLYHKSEILYGLFEAKNAIREKGVILVEGYMDALACHQAGFTQTVATSGTALTSQHVKLLKRFTDTFYFCFDKDGAGWEASKRAFTEVMAQDGFIKMIEIPSGKDPADSLMESSEAFYEATKKARPFLEVFYDHIFAQFSESLKIMQEVLPFLRALKSRVALDLAVRDLAQRLNVREASIYDELNALPAVRTFAVEKKQDESPARNLSPEETLLVILFQIPEKFSLVRERLQSLRIDGNLSSLFDFLLEQDVFDPVTFREQLSVDDQKRLQFLSFYGETVYAQLRPEQLQKDLVSSLDKIELNQKNKHLETLKQKIRTLEKEGKSDESRLVLEEMRTIFKGESRKN